MANRRTNGEGNIRQRADGVWEARIQINEERKSIYGSTKKDAVDKLNKLKADVAFNLYVKDEGITVEEWLNTWLSSYCLSIKDTTRGKYASDLRLHIIPALGKIHLVKLDGAMIQRFYSSLVKKGIAPKSVRNLHGTLHKALNQAVKLGIIRVNPADACDLPKVIKHEMTPIPDDELGNFLNAIKDSPYYAYYYVMIFTGMRRAELIGLTWDCVNFVRGTIRVYRQFNRNLTKPGSQYEFMTLKNGKERTFRPAQSVMDVLRRVKKEQAENRIACGAAWMNDQNFVFTHKNGKYLNGNSVYAQFKKIVKAMGIGETSLHDLRHTFATLSLENGTDVKTISEALGHATTAFTMDVYGHVSEAMQRDASDRMERLIQGL